MPVRLVASVIRPTPPKNAAYRGRENANYLSYPGLALQRVSSPSKCGDTLLYAQLPKSLFRVPSVISDAKFSFHARLTDLYPPALVLLFMQVDESKISRWIKRGAEWGPGPPRRG